MKVMNELGMEDPKSPSNMGDENHGGGIATSDQSRDETSAIQQKVYEYRDNASDAASEDHDRPS